MSPDLGTVATGIAVLASFGAFARWVWPKWRAFGRKVDAGLSAVIGNEEVRHPASGRVIAPARPGLGVWMATTDDALTTLSTAVRALAEQHGRLDDHEHRLGVLGIRVDRLEAASVERIVSRADSTAAWGAMQAASESTPPPRDSEIED